MITVPHFVYSWSTIHHIKTKYNLYYIIHQHTINRLTSKMTKTFSKFIHLTEKECLADLNECVDINVGRRVCMLSLSVMLFLNISFPLLLYRNTKILYSNKCASYTHTNQIKITFFGYLHLLVCSARTYHSPATISYIIVHI